MGLDVTGKLHACWSPLPELRSSIEMDVKQYLDLHAKVSLFKDCSS